MDNQALIHYFKSTVLYQCIDEDTSDVIYNGQHLWIEFVTGEKKIAPITFSSQVAFETIKRLADLSGKNFNYAHPILDLAFSYYRLNAIHPCLVFSEYEPRINFSLRIASRVNRIKKKESDYAPSRVMTLLKHLVSQQQSIFIGGKTGSGKSELQRFLLEHIPVQKRVIMLQDTAEIIPLPYSNTTTWLYATNSDLERLFQAGLRSNPDWFLLSEVRGDEAGYLLAALTSGLSTLTTIHSRQAKEIPNRFLHLLKLASKESLLHAKKELASAVNFYVQVEAYLFQSKKRRRIAEIFLLYEYENVLYEKIIYSIKQKEIWMGDLPQCVANACEIRRDWYAETTD